MKIPLPFLKTKKETNEFYLALLLTDEKTSAVILQESQGIVKVIGKHEESLKTPLEDIPQDELISIIDKTISRAEEVLPADVETHKTVFGLKESWVEDESKKIKKDYLVKLKKICDALDMKPIGFMVISEAIANLLQTEEGAPLSAILVEIDTRTVNLTLFRAGKISESQSGPLDGATTVVVDRLLSHFTAPVLPTKIILYNTKEAKDLTHKLMKHEWDKKLPFLHPPQVTLLSPDFDARAVTYGASQQMGFELSGISDKFTHTESPVEKIHESEVSEGDNFGFVNDADIADEKPPEPLIEGEMEKEEAEEEPHINLHEDHEAEAKTAVAIDDQIDMPEEFPKEKKSNILSSVKSLFLSIPLPKTPKISEFLTKNKGVKLPIIIAGSVLAIIIIAFISYFFTTRAEIVLSVKPNIVEQDEDVTFSTTSTSDFSENIIAAENVSTSLDGDLSANATGKKDVGEKAKGTVTIYSELQSSKTFPSGTVIKNNDLEFTLDKEVSVASSSGDVGDVKTVKVDVTAKQSGTESNLPSGAKFNIAGFDTSDVVAKNDSAFSGGTKKTITVVSKKDMDKLKIDLVKDLEKKALDELSKKVEDDRTILPVIVSSSVDKEKFDRKVDDEAKTVKLTATIHFEGMTYGNDEIKDYEKSVLKSNHSQDISFDDKSFKTEIKDPVVKNKKDIQAKLSMTAGLLPKIEQSEVINKIKDKSPSSAKEILATLPQVAKSEIKFSPNILFLPNLFPRLPNNISITVKSDE